MADGLSLRVALYQIARSLCKHKTMKQLPSVAIVAAVLSQWH